MICVVYGTTGELIKLAPVLRALERDGAAPLTLCTGQQPEQIPQMLDDFGLPPPSLWLARGRRGADLQRAADVPSWLADVSRGVGRAWRALRRRLRTDSQPLVLVHGDTLTTVLGATIGRGLSVPVAHLEAGLRSGDWRNPFPEEVNRLAASRLAAIHLAPGVWAARNLVHAGVRGEIVDIGGNTIRDALALVPPGLPPGVAAPEQPFGLVSLHRFELLRDARALRALLELLARASVRTPLLFVDHPVTARAIADHHLDGLFGPSLRRIPRQRYFPFIALLRASAFLVTDSGGSQEECAHLRHPCLVHRAATERREGLEGPVVLSRLDLGVVRRFLEDPRRPSVPAPDDEPHPTAAVMAYLRRRGFVTPDGSGPRR